MKKLPVTVLSGFLGADETTLFNYMLQSRQGLKVAFIINGTSEINVDVQLVSQQNTLSRTNEKLVEISNDCICYTFHEDLMLEVGKLVHENRFDYLLIVSSGMFEPLPVAQTFSFRSDDSVDEAQSIDLSQFSHLDTLVTVVDAFNFHQDFGSVDTVHERDLNGDAADTHTIVNLLTDQLEFANVTIFNKTDLLGRLQIGGVKAILHKLSPKAKLLEKQFSKLEPAQILDTHLFDFEEDSQSADWIQELQNHKNQAEHTPEMGEDNVASFVFPDRRPLHPACFWQYLDDNFLRGIIGSKGLFCLTSRPDNALNCSQAGVSQRAERAGAWWALMPFSHWVPHGAFLEHQQAIETRWHKRFGDRQNELVIIGQDINQAQIIAELQDCLCTEFELKHMENQGAFKDPFPVWE